MALTALLEPTMILVMGGVVLTIVLAVLMPIMEMNQLVQWIYAMRGWIARRASYAVHPRMAWIY
ncbi:TPA: hypothetical protein ACKPZV_002819 [Stenotrophomonas maltophilia]